jgi:anti-anti-sigma factor
MGSEDWRGERDAELRVSLGRLDGWTVASLAGEIDILTAPTLRARLRDLVGDHGRRPRVIIDLGDVTFCDAGGLGALVGAHRVALRRGGTVRLVVPPGRVRRLLRIANPTHELEVHDTLNDAVALGLA